MCFFPLAAWTCIAQLFEQMRDDQREVDRFENEGGLIDFAREHRDAEILSGRA